MVRAGRARRAGVVAALCAAAVLLLGACGTRVAGQDSGMSPPTAGPIPWTTVQPSAVTGVRLSADRRTLILDAQVPSGAHPCVRDLKAVLTEPVPGSVRVQITFSSPSSDRRSGCTKESTATTRVRLPEPLGDEEVVVDHSTQFIAESPGSATLRPCGRLGCHPPATGCTPASYDQALLAVGAPAHTVRDAAGCDGKWLVLDFSWRTGPACGDDTAGAACSSRLGDRWFFRAEPAGWVPVTKSAAGGCRDVRRAEPVFPAPLCDTLPPLSAALHPHYAPPSATTGPAGRMP